MINANEIKYEWSDEHKRNIIVLPKMIETWHIYIILGEIAETIVEFNSNEFEARMKIR